VATEFAIRDSDYLTHRIVAASLVSVHGRENSPRKATEKRGEIPGAVETPLFLGTYGLGGAPDWIRTSGLKIRSLVLYPAELRARGAWLMVRRAAPQGAGEKDGAPVLEARKTQPTASSSRPNALANSAWPSVPPWSASTARSGCGIRPSTLPAALTIPAMSRADPLTGSA
jgi:hypothetical protein